MAVGAAVNVEVCGCAKVKKEAKRQIASSRLQGCRDCICCRAMQWEWGRGCVFNFTVLSFRTSKDVVSKYCVCVLVARMVALLG